MTILKAIQKMFEARDCMHLLHLNTKSYAEHKALDSFYIDWLELVDSFIETYQGKYGRVSGAISIETGTMYDAETYLKDLIVFTNTDLEPLVAQEDSDLLNIIADMKGLINHTLYLLTLK